MYSRMTEVFFCGCVCTVQGRPSTVASLNSCPTVKVTWVVLTEVEVLTDRVSPSCVISTDGFDAAATAILRSITFTPDKTHICTSEQSPEEQWVLASIEVMENCSFIKFKGQKEPVGQIRGMKAMLLRLAVLHTSALSADTVWGDHLI